MALDMTVHDPLLCEDLSFLAQPSVSAFRARGRIRSERGGPPTKLSPQDLGRKRIVVGGFLAWTDPPGGDEHQPLAALPPAGPAGWPGPAGLLLWFLPRSGRSVSPRRSVCHVSARRLWSSSRLKGYYSSEQGREYPRNSALGYLL